MSLIQWTQKCRFIVFCNKCILLTLSITPSHPLYSSWAISQTLHSVSACLQYYWNSKLSHCACSVKLRHVPPAVCHFSFWGHAGQRHSHIAALLNMWHHSKNNWPQLWPHDLSQLSRIIHLCRTSNTHTGSENWDILSYVKTVQILS